MLDDSFKLKFKTMQLMCTDENRNVDLHNHNEFEILLFTKGTPEIVIKNDSFCVKKDDMVFINPLEIHSVKNNKRPYSLKCICFNASLISDEKIRKKMSEGNIQIQHYIDAAKCDISYIKTLFLKIFEVYEKTDEWSETEILAYMNLMFIYLFRNNYILKEEPNSKSSAFCTAALEYIAAHYREDISSNDISKALSYSQGYFCRKFHFEFGKSFSQYLTMYRVSMSKILLEEKECTVSDVANRCGFSSADYFSKCFRKMVGILPSEYKKVVKGAEK